MQHYRFVYLGLSLILISLFLTAGTTGKISGKVTDSKSKEGIPSAVVTIVGTTLGAATDPEGAYVILNVPPGTYSVSVSYVGYQPMRINNIGVNVDYTTTLNIQLKESAVELNEFVVEGERNPLVRQDQTNPVAAITAENIQSLPVTTISEVIGLQAGVVTSDDGTLHVRGGRSNEISFTLNGISVNDPYNNLSSIGVATNAVQEVTVSTGTFSAEYGNALSGIVNYVTKEGGTKNSASLRILSGDYYSKRTGVFPHIDKYQPLNNGRAEATLGGPTFVEGLSFYASGVFDRTNGYLYGNRIYNTTDFYVTRDDLTKQFPYTFADGTPIPNPSTPGFPFYTDDTRRMQNSDPYYFNPLGRQLQYALIPNSGGVYFPYFDSLGAPSGDNALVPLNPSQSYNIQGNLLFRLSSTMKLKYEFVLDNGKSQSASYYTYRFNPDGRPTSYSNGIVQALDWTHTLSNSVFYTLKGSYSNSDDKSYTYEDINDPRYLPAFYQTSLPIVGFLTGGTTLARSFRNSKAFGLKADIQAQMFEVHEVKAGIEVRQHEINVESYTLEFYNVKDPTDVINDFQDIYADGKKYKARKPNKESGYLNYKKEPTQISMYVQDKIELDKSFILNAGVRYEYFDPAAQYNPVLSEAISRRDTTFLFADLKKATVKHTFSPRIGISYPITDEGTIRFSYGHFYQLGNLSSLYSNNNFRVSGSTPSFGNSNVRPQRSVQYEIGLQQGLTPDLRLEVVGFYKDVRDYIYNQTVITSKGDIRYQVLTNLDYSNARGITVSLFQRRAPGTLLSSSVDYTFSVAEGNRTEPEDDFFYSEKEGKAAETFLVPLSFDRSHTLTTTISLSEPDDFNIGSTIRLQTGTPYTASIPTNITSQQAIFVQNSSTKPFQWSIDLKAEKYFILGDLRYSLFLLIDNLFDTENETSVYANSGKALYNADQVANPTQFSEMNKRLNRGDVGLIPMSAVTNYYVDPTNVNRPRLVRLGFSVLF